MIIASAADERFVAHFAAMLHAAWTHNPAARFVLLDCGIRPESQALLTSFASERGIDLHIMPIKTTRFDGLPTTKFWSLAIYARLLLPSLLPSTERVIYLDADTVPVDNLSDLWKMPMSHHAIAGVRDPGGAKADEYYDGPYVNSGVLVMNLQAWREGFLADLAMTYIRTHKLKLPDQTAINAVCVQQIRLLPDECNFMVGASWRTMLGWRKPPRIIHCTGVYKPWHYHDVPFAQIYLWHRSQTPFPLDKPPRRAYRGPLRKTFSLLIGRPKYWRRFLMERHCRRFVGQYLAEMSGKRIGFDIASQNWSARDIGVLAVRVLLIATSVSAGATAILAAFAWWLIIES